MRRLNGCQAFVRGNVFLPVLKHELMRSVVVDRLAQAPLGTRIALFSRRRVLGDLQTELQIGVAAAASLYVIWLAYRVYMAFGKCPRCSQRLARSADVCGACGCRPHEKPTSRSQGIQRRSAAS